MWRISAKRLRCCCVQDREGIYKMGRAGGGRGMGNMNQHLTAALTFRRHFFPPLFWKRMRLETMGNATSDKKKSLTMTYTFSHWVAKQKPSIKNCINKTGGTRHLSCRQSPKQWASYKKKSFKGRSDLQYSTLTVQYCTELAFAFYGYQSPNPSHD